MLDFSNMNNAGEEIKHYIQQALKSLDLPETAFSVEHPEDFSHGDYSTNVALVCAKSAKANPKELAEKIKEELSKLNLGLVEKIEIAGPGFINFYLHKNYFSGMIEKINADPENWAKNTSLSGKKIMTEYTDPNPFKPFHIGHLMTNAIGESVARILSFSGAKIIRANYQGDVGMHVAKAIFGMYKAGPPGDESASPEILAEYIGKCYASGSDLYENDATAKTEIDALNKKIYDRSDTEVNKIYDWGRKITLEAFETIYKKLGTKFNHYFFESEMAPIGDGIVKENMPKVFEESDGAIVFHAEKFNPKLNPRVFITSAGLPTYEAKELGLTKTKFEKENPDLSIVVTANEQDNYMKVVTTALSIIHPDWADRMKHIVHGMMRFAEGKMSSRKGNVITGESLLKDAEQMVYEKMKDREFVEEDKKQISEIVGVGAIKYSILRSSSNSDIVFDFEKSISFEGDSGPYLQYTAVRANALLEKGQTAGIVLDAELPTNWETTELEKYLARFDEVVLHSATEYEPHYITTYLTALASSFNSFYAGGKIVDATDDSSSYKLALVQAFFNVMKNGLGLLAIQIPEKM